MPITHSDLWPQVTSWDNLYSGYTAARKGKRYRPEVLKFTANIEENILNIQNHLYWKTWRPGAWREFMVYEPKARFIQAPPFKDRVVHHALVSIIGPLFERKFIYDSYACRVSKGTHAAVMRLQSFLRRAQLKWGRVYVLKADISRYFPSIRHDRLLKIIRQTIRDKDALWLCETMLHECGEHGKGIPVGALPSQLFANIYLSQLDHFIKEGMGIKFYLRYMDDWVVLSAGKERLREVWELAEDFLSVELGLTLNPKTSIFPASCGVDFCGYRIWATHLLPRKRNTTRMRRRLRKMSMLYAEGRITLQAVRSSVMSFLGYMKYCCGHRTTQSILNEHVFKKNSR